IGKGGASFAVSFLEEHAMLAIKSTLSVDRSGERSPGDQRPQQQYIIGVERDGIVLVARQDYDGNGQYKAFIDRYAKDGKRTTVFKQPSSKGSPWNFVSASSTPDHGALAFTRRVDTLRQSTDSIENAVVESQAYECYIHYRGENTVVDKGLKQYARLQFLHHEASQPQQPTYLFICDKERALQSTVKFGANKKATEVAQYTVHGEHLWSQFVPHSNTLFIVSAKKREQSRTPNYLTTDCSLKGYVCRPGSSPSGATISVSFLLDVPASAFVFPTSYHNHPWLNSAPDKYLKLQLVSVPEKRKKGQQSSSQADEKSGMLVLAQQRSVADTIRVTLFCFLNKYKITLYISPEPSLPPFPRSVPVFIGALRKKVLVVFLPGYFVYLVDMLHRRPSRLLLGAFTPEMTLLPRKETELPFPREVLEESVDNTSASALQFGASVSKYDPDGSVLSAQRHDSGFFSSPPYAGGTENEDRSHRTHTEDGRSSSPATPWPKPATPNAAPASSPTPLGSPPVSSSPHFGSLGFTPSLCGGSVCSPVRRGSPPSAMLGSLVVNQRPVLVDLTTCTVYNYELSEKNFMEWFLHRASSLQLPPLMHYLIGHLPEVSLSPLDALKKLSRSRPDALTPDVFKEYLLGITHVKIRDGCKKGDNDSYELLNVIPKTTLTASSGLKTGLEHCSADVRPLVRGAGADKVLSLPVFLNFESVHNGELTAKHSMRSDSSSGSPQSGMKIFSRLKEKLSKDFSAAKNNQPGVATLQKAVGDCFEENLVEQLIRGGSRTEVRNGIEATTPPIWQNFARPKAAAFVAEYRKEVDRAVETLVTEILSALHSSQAWPDAKPSQRHVYNVLFSISVALQELSFPQSKVLNEQLTLAAFQSCTRRSFLQLLRRGVVYLDADLLEHLKKEQYQTELLPDEEKDFFMQLSLHLDSMQQRIETVEEDRLCTEFLLQHYQAQAMKEAEGTHIADKFGPITTFYPFERLRSIWENAPSDSRARSYLELAAPEWMAQHLSPLVEMRGSKPGGGD
ncbi:hypothetical protein DIPPA_20420, partial [Diplonema papillatum]